MEIRIDTRRPFVGFYGIVRMFVVIFEIMEKYFTFSKRCNGFVHI